MKLNKTFAINGAGYHTDAETLKVFHTAMDAGDNGGDYSAAIAMIALGEATGRIVKMSDAEYAKHIEATKPIGRGVSRLRWLGLH